MYDQILWYVCSDRDLEICRYDVSKIVTWKGFKIIFVLSKIFEHITSQEIHLVSLDEVLDLLKYASTHVQVIVEIRWREWRAQSKRCGVALPGVFPVWDAWWPLTCVRHNNKGAKHQIFCNIKFFNGYLICLINTIVMVRCGCYSKLQPLEWDGDLLNNMQMAPRTFLNGYLIFIWSKSRAQL